MDCTSRAIPKRSMAGSIILKPTERLPSVRPVGGLFPPQDPEREPVLETVHQSPQQHGLSASRWTLALLRQASPLLAGFKSLSGVLGRLKKWQIRWKRGRAYVTSPDPAYLSKLQAVEQALLLARQQPEQVSVLYADETTCHRQPLVGSTWHEQGAGGRHQPRAVLAQARNSVRRIVGTLDALTGRVLYRANSKSGVSQLVAFLKQVRKAYGPERRLLLIWDNWPIHYYDRVLAEAAAQRIELLNLPTYAPWTNPIEKLWRKLKQEVLCMHRISDQWLQLKQQVHAFLKSYDRPAPDLLRYVGLAQLAD